MMVGFAYTKTLNHGIMYTKVNLILIAALLYVIAGCDVIAADNRCSDKNVDLIKNPFLESQDEIQAVLDGIFKAIQDKDADKLISYHVYGDKFTEFRDSEYRFNSEENEQFERGLVGAISGFDYNLGDLKINVFGDVAVVTFHADFRPVFGEDVVQLWESTTLVFVNVGGEWKITHEHHSPLNVE
jgi:ketosteroid isomerase-like protein